MAQTTSSSAPSNEQRDLGERLREPGAWSWAYVDASDNRADPRRLAALRRRGIGEDLASDSAADADIALIEAELAEEPGVPAPVSRYVLVREGEVVLSAILPGHMHGPEAVGHGPVPDLLPLLAHRPLDISFLVVEVGRQGGGYRAYRLGHAEAKGSEDQEYVQGRTDSLHKPAGGGWNQMPWQHHVEEIWKQTEGEVADAVEEAVQRLRPRLIVLAGDIRARQLFLGRLAEGTRVLVSEAPVDPRASDASETALVEHVDIALARVVAQRRHDVEDLLTTHAGRGDRETASGLGPVVTALAQAQVSTLVLDAAALADRTVLALDGAPWVATAPEDALDATVVGTVPASIGLVRAALATDAEVVLANAASLPEHAPTAALLRWPIGPEVPGTGPAGEGADAG